MRRIAERYRGKSTSRGHEIRVDERGDETIIWYLFWGTLAGIDDHHHVGIARVRRDGDEWVAGFLRGTEQRPHETRRYPTLDALCIDLDKAIEAR